MQVNSQEYSVEEVKLSGNTVTLIVKYPVSQVAASAAQVLDTGNTSEETIEVIYTSTKDKELQDVFGTKIAKEGEENSTTVTVISFDSEVNATYVESTGSVDIYLTLNNDDDETITLLNTGTNLKDCFTITSTTQESARSSQTVTPTAVELENGADGYNNVLKLTINSDDVTKLEDGFTISYDDAKASGDKITYSTIITGTGLTDDGFASTDTKVSLTICSLPEVEYESLTTLGFDTSVDPTYMKTTAIDSSGSNTTKSTTTEYLYLTLNNVVETSGEGNDIDASYFSVKVGNSTLQLRQHLPK